jgi:hypothetical protein
VFKDENTRKMFHVKQRDQHEVLGNYSFPLMLLLALEIALAVFMIDIYKRGSFGQEPHPFFLGT